MRWLSKLLGLANRAHGVDVEPQEWVAVDGVADTARLVRALLGMPRDAVLSVVRPHGAVEGVARAAALPGSHPEDGVYLCPMTPAVIGELAAAVETQAPSPPCAGILVSLGERHLLEAFRRDAGEDVVWLASDLPAPVIAQMRRALDPGSAAPAPPRATYPVPSERAMRSA
jgi:hypothetical protein